MSGKEMLEAMGYVDERLVHEADTVTPAKPAALWLRWGSLAACLCIAVVGAISIGHYLQDNSSAPESAPLENTHPVMVAPPEDLFPETIEPGVLEPTPGVGMESVGEVPSIALRIDAWQEDSFRATVIGLVDTAVYSPGTQLTVRFQKAVTLPDGTTVSCWDSIPTEEDFPVGTQVIAMFYTEDPGSNEIQIESMVLIDKGGTP